DGDADLYVTTVRGGNMLFENDGKGHFKDVSKASGLDYVGHSSAAVFFDYDRDGKLDLFLVNVGRYTTNRIAGDGYKYYVGIDKVGPEHEKMKSTMKWPASVVGNGTASIWGNSLFLKEGPGKFRELSDSMGAENYCPWGPSVGDLNADGYDDAFIASGMNYPYRYMVNSVKLNNRGRRFVDSEFVLGVEPRRGLIVPWFDLDASGADKNHRDAAG